MTKNYTFEVEVIESGQRKRYGDSYYTYKITSDLPEQIVRQFAKNVLRKSYLPIDMPSPFSTEFISFELESDGKSNVYIYKSKELYTD